MQTIEMQWRLKNGRRVEKLIRCIKDTEQERNPCINPNKLPANHKNSEKAFVCLLPVPLLLFFYLLNHKVLPHKNHESEKPLIVFHCSIVLLLRYHSCPTTVLFLSG